MLEFNCGLVISKDSVEAKDLVHVKELFGVKNDVNATKLASPMTMILQKLTIKIISYKIFLSSLI